MEAFREALPGAASGDNARSTLATLLYEIAEHSIIGLPTSRTKWDAGRSPSGTGPDPHRAAWETRHPTPTCVVAARAQLGLRRPADRVPDRRPPRL